MGLWTRVRLPPNPLKHVNPNSVSSDFLSNVSAPHLSDRLGTGGSTSPGYPVKHISSLHENQLKLLEKRYIECQNFLKYVIII